MNTGAKDREIVLEVRHIFKHFGKVQALDDISLSFYKGEIHTLLGENGAGKTTLMNIIYGLYHSDRGEIFINGRRQVIKSPQDSLHLGIGMVPQFFKLIPNMSIVENIFLFIPKKKFILNKRELREKTRELSRLFRFGLDDKLDVNIFNLSEGEKQKVEILKLLISQSTIMLFDEATNVLAPNELEAFLKVIKDMNRRGYTIFYITHRLQEALEISDRISVFRKGKLVGTISGEEATSQKLTRMMIGEEIGQTLNISPAKSEKKIITVSGIKMMDERKLHVIQDISFDLYEGEIVGLAGIDGNGSDFLAEGIMGLLPLQGGKITFRGEDITTLSPQERMSKGIKFIPGADNQVPLFTIRKNSILDYPGEEPFSHKGILNNRSITKHAEKIVQTYRVQTPSIMLLAEKLSGGNKQRLALGRKIESDPELLIAYHPTKGLDIGSQNFIYEKFLELKERGSTIFFMGTDLDELFLICNRLMVIYRGEILRVFNDISRVSKFDIGLLMTGGSSYIEKETV